MDSFAIVVIGYNRLRGMKRLLESLEKVDYNGRDDIHLIFSIDHSGTNDVFDFANNYKWAYGEKHIRTFAERQGLKNHILSCGDYTEIYDIVVVLEDDLYVSDSMYHYAYQAVSFYKNDDNVAGISLYAMQKNWLNWVLRFEPQMTKYDAYFLKLAQSWGQVWTREKWSSFKAWYEQNKNFSKSEKIPNALFDWPESSWLKYHRRYCIETNRFFVYPYVSLSTTFADAGEHSNQTTTDFQVELMYGKKEYSFPNFSSDEVLYDEYMDRIGLAKYLGINEEDITVDFWGTKSSSLYKKYLITLESLDYKIVKSFGLSLRPIELSVINNISGSGIYLYDTEKPTKNKKKNGSFNRMLYSFRSRQSNKVLHFALKLRIIDIKNRVISKFKKKVHIVKS